MARTKKSPESKLSIIDTIVRIWWVWPLLALFATYFIVMWLSIGQSVWFDEGYSITLARQPVGELLALTAVDAHPPFYYLLLKAWANIFGWSEYALRSLSAVAAALTVGIVFLTVRKLFTVRTALVLLPVLVFAPFALRYGYEIRMYALASLIGAVATLVLVYARERASVKLWGIYAVLVALGMYTLYMMAALWIAHLVWLVLVSKQKKGDTFFKQQWVLAFAGAVILFIPYIITFVNQLLHSALPGIGNALTITRLGDIMSMTVLFTPEWKVTGILALGLITILVLATYLTLFIRRHLPIDQRSGLLLLLILVIVPIVFFAVTSLAKPIFVNRYMAHVVIYSYALLGVIIALGWRYGQKLLSGLLLVVSLTLLLLGVVQLQQTGNFIFERLQKPQTSEMRSAVTCDDSVTVVADDPYTFIDTRYYFDDCDLRFYAVDSVERRGGYAPLHGSAARVSQQSDVTSENLIHLRWDGATPSFVPDDRYQLVQTTTYDKQVVDEYQLVNQ